MKRVLVLLAAGLMAGMAAGPGAAAGTLPVANPHAVVHGMDQSQWEGAYQVWLEEIPTAKNPLTDASSPRNCEVQPGNVAFAGASGANCHVPPGVWIGISSYFWECSTAEGLGHTFSQLRHCAEHNFARDFGPDDFHDTILVDGVQVHHPRKWIFTTPGEVIDFPKHNIFGADPGRSKSVTKGNFFLVKPFAHGRHEVIDRVRFPDGTGFNIEWVFHVG
jgi:hypothetical protein